MKIINNLINDDGTITKRAFIDKSIISDKIYSSADELPDNEYITDANNFYIPKGDSETNTYSWAPAQEQKIQFSLNEPYTVMMNGWFVVNPEPLNIPERWTISIGQKDENDNIEYRPMFHSDDDGNMSVSILVKAGQVITSDATSSKSGYFMPCKPELNDWREEDKKSDDVDIWKNAIRKSDQKLANQWIENTSASNWNATYGYTYGSTLSCINGDEAFKADGTHSFYIQTENIKTGYNMFRYCESLASFNGDLSSLTNGNSMFFYCNSLASFNNDLSSLTDGTDMFRYCDSLASFNNDLPSLTNGNSMFYQTKIESFNGDLSSLTDSTDMFAYCDSLASFSGDLSNLKICNRMFSNCENLKSFAGDFRNLTNSEDIGNTEYPKNGMFNYCNSLESFTGDLSKLVTGYNMFFNCFKLKDFNCTSLDSLVNGFQMFCVQTDTSDPSPSLTSFNYNLPKLQNGKSMFQSQKLLTTFNGNLGSLTDGTSMFSGCKLDLASVENIASTINTVSSGTITIGIQASLQGKTALAEALTAIEGKGWTVTTQYNS